VQDFSYEKGMTSPKVIAVCSSPRHGMAKDPRTVIHLVAGMGVDGDAHQGTTTQHLYLRKKEPKRSNLTQVHLLHFELYHLLDSLGFSFSPGMLGENITTQDINLMSLPTWTRLEVGDSILKLTGYREPCRKLDRLKPGLMKATFVREPSARIVPNLGVMAVVVRTGDARPGDIIKVSLPDPPHVALASV